MKKWIELSTEEKLDRLADIAHTTLLNQKTEPIPGYQLLDVSLSLEGWDDYLGVYPQTREIK